MADKRNTVEYVKNYIEKNIGYLLLSNEYKNNKTPLLVKCDKGHEYTTTWNRISSKGARCPECDKIKRIEKQTFSYDFVKNIIEKEDYKLLSNNYVKSIMPLKIKCDKGHIFEMTFNNFYNQNQRCPYCAGVVKLTYDYVKKIIENETGYFLLSEKYMNNRKKLKIKCDKGHIFEMTFGDFKQGHRCPICFGNVKYTDEYVKNLFIKDDYLLLDKYKNNHSLMKVKCDKGHIYKTSLKRYINNHRCPLCFKNGQVSKSEKRVLKIVKNIYNGIVFENCKNVIKNPKTNRYLELDIWMPELNKAIEYNGYYYHSSPEVIERDKIKMNQFNNLQINLLVIKDVNWKTENEKINSLVKDFIQR